MIVLAFGDISVLGDAGRRPGHAVNKAFRRLRIHLQSSMGRLVKDVPLPARFSSKPDSLNAGDFRSPHGEWPMR